MLVCLDEAVGEDATLAGSLPRGQTAFCCGHETHGRGLQAFLGRYDLGFCQEALS